MQAVANHAQPSCYESAGSPHMRMELNWGSTVEGRLYASLTYCDIIVRNFFQTPCIGIRSLKNLIHVFFLFLFELSIQEAVTQMATNKVEKVTFA